MIKTESLYYLIKVAQYNSISKAAEDINITPSAITHSLKQLEDELYGISLYNRTSKGITMTDEGQAIAEIAREVLNRLNAVKLYAKAQISNSLSDEIQGHAILCLYHIMADNLSFLPLDIHKSHPHLDFSLIEIQNINILMDSINKDKDIYSLFYVDESFLDKLTAIYSNISYIILAKGSFNLRVPQNSKLVPYSIKEVTWKQVSELPLVLDYQNTYIAEVLFHRLSKYNCNLNFPVYPLTGTMYSKIILEDIAVGIVPSIAYFKTATNTSDYRLIPIRDNTADIQLAFFHHKLADKSIINLIIDKIN